MSVLEDLLASKATFEDELRKSKKRFNDSVGYVQLEWARYCDDLERYEETLEFAATIVTKAPTLYHYLTDYYSKPVWKSYEDKYMAQAHEQVVHYTTLLEELDALAQ